MFGAALERQPKKTNNNGERNDNLLDEQSAAEIYAHQMG